MKKTILHLCADIGSDSRFFQLDENFEVVMVGKDIGVENFTFDGEVYGIIANPVCTNFSTANYHNSRNIEDGLDLVKHCQRIIRETNPKFWVIENPATGLLREYLGKPKNIYQPWQYGSPWTKKTALWGQYNMPKPRFNAWEEVPKNPKIYARPNRKPSLAFLHKSAVVDIPEMQWAKDRIDSDMSIRSWCSQGFAEDFYLNNRGY